MPPRKRAASAPKEEPTQETEAPETEADGQQAALPDEPPPVPDEAAEQAADSGAPDDGEGDGDQGPDAEADSGADPERSDLQTADKPCEECMPNGWPEGAYSVGCTHGTWVRKQD